MEFRETLSVQQAALKHLLASDQKIRDLFDLGELGGYRLGSKRVIFADSVVHYQERNSNKKESSPSSYGDEDSSHCSHT